MQNNPLSVNGIHTPGHHYCDIRSIDKARPRKRLHKWSIWEIAEGTMPRSVVRGNIATLSGDGYLHVVLALRIASSGNIDSCDQAPSHFTLVCIVWRPRTYL